uniref:30S ribosomal protein S20 n=1 Tax=Wildemania schizophylla TaxID=1134705 RepID=A0A126G496_WILSC|nr:30S ribosomal protein S20 [Wildemania schizophylla]AKS28396.1 30S ribosomal protein S20 [Wildemania schizophylla]
MAKNLSAIKRIKTSERNRIINRKYKSVVKTLTKRFLLNIDNLETSNMNDLQSSISQVYSKIDKAIKKGVFHTNTGARKKARLARAFAYAQKNRINQINNTCLS